jgi:hypothetical protein
VLYRSLERYDDEVRLLERYRDSQHDDALRLRFDARITTARALANRHRKRHAGSRPPAGPPSTQPVAAAAFADAVSIHAVAAVRAALTDMALDQGSSSQLHAALARLCDEARDRGFLAEHVVIALKDVWRGIRRPFLVGPVEWDMVYQRALRMTLDIYFDEPTPPPA